MQRRREAICEKKKKVVRKLVMRKEMEKLEWIPCKRSYGIANGAAIGRNEAGRT